MNKNVDAVDGTTKLLITPAVPTTNNSNGYISASNNIFNHQIFNSHSDITCINSNDCANGTYSTVPPLMSPFLNDHKSALQVGGNSILYNIIAKDVNHPKNNKLTEENIDSRKTVVKKAPDGAVQITYKNMINTAPMKNSTPVYILPKPSNQHSTSKENPLQTSKTCKGIHFSSRGEKTIDSAICTNGNNLIQISHSDNTNNLSIHLPKISSKKNTLYSQDRYLNFLSNEQDHSNNISVNTMEPNSNSTCSVRPRITTDCISTNSGLQGTLAENPFNGIDIDLSCLNTDTFEPSHDFFLSTDTTLHDHGDAMNEVSTFLSTSSTHNNGHLNCYSHPVTACDVQQPTSCFTNSYSYLHNTQSSVEINMISNIPSKTKQRINKLLDITDVSPECAPSTGGSKIILIGSWNAKDARYQCQFGIFIVDAELVQSGVLRCYSPIHKPGTVKLSVLCDDVVISEQTDFIFVNICKKKNNGKLHDQWLSITNKSLVQLLVERISFIAEMIGQADSTETSSHILNAGEDGIEQKLVGVCKKLMTTSIDFQFDYDIENTMTILHLAAARGYVKLIQLLMNWVETNPTKLILAEANPRCFDQFFLLPIMWSSAKGHFNTTCVLHQWAEDTLDWKDQCGCHALSLATECGHGSLVEYLGRLLKKSAIARDEQSMHSNHSPSSSIYKKKIHGAEDSSPKTLGKALAYIQSMLNDHDDEKMRDDMMSDDGENFNNIDEDDDVENASLFDVPPFPAASMLSPDSPSQASLQSPFNRQIRETAEFCEFFYKAKRIEKDFAELTLTDEEQEELYRAANVIQTAYKSYKERSKQRDQEFSSATLIQSYYRRYKQYAAFKKMQKGAVLIQNRYRAHREKAKKKWEAASLIQSYYRRYRQRKHCGGEHKSIQKKNKQTQQANRRACRFLQQSSNRFSCDLNEDFQFVSSSVNTNNDQ